MADVHTAPTLHLVRSESGTPLHRRRAAYLLVPGTETQRREHHWQLPGSCWQTDNMHLAMSSSFGKNENGNEFNATRRALLLPRCMCRVFVFRTVGMSTYVLYSAHHTYESLSTHHRQLATLPRFFQIGLPVKSRVPGRRSSSVLSGNNSREMEAACQPMRAHAKTGNGHVY